jgi:hypothetical protein
MYTQIPQLLGNFAQRKLSALILRNTWDQLGTEDVGIGCATNTLPVPLTCHNLRCNCKKTTQLAQDMRKAWLDL